MPKETFLNLSEHKKAKIFAAAIEEFSTRRFSDASINQIVKNAGISRGSFYQYFDDKEDLYLYMIDEISKEKLALLGHVNTLHADADFFDTYLQMFRAAIQWAKEKPAYSQVGMLMELDDSAFIAKLREINSRGFELLKELVERDKKRGRIKAEIDTALITDVVYTLNMHLLKEHQQAGDYEGMERKINEIFAILKHGILR